MYTAGNPAGAMPDGAPAQSRPAMDAPSALETARTLGLTLPSPAYLFFAIVFGVVGIAAFRLGRRRERPPTVVMGLALMFYPYLVSGTGWLVAIGAALCAGVWFDLRR